MDLLANDRVAATRAGFIDASARVRSPLGRDSAQRGQREVVLQSVGVMIGGAGESAQPVGMGTGNSWISKSDRI